MATTSYLTPEDQAFINAWRTQTAGTSYAKWGTTLPKLYSYADKLKEIQSYYTEAKTPQTRQLAIDLGVEWLKANNPGILDETGNPFGNGFYVDIISGDNATQKSANDTLNKIRNTNATQYIDSVLNADKNLGTAQKAAEIAKITQGTIADPYNPTKLATAVNSIRSSAYVQPGTSVDTLKTNYGGLKNADGTPLFSDADFQEVANAKTLGAITKFNNKLDSLANKVVNSTASTYVTADPTTIAAAKKDLLANPAGFVAKVNALNKPTTTTTSTSADTSSGGTGNTSTGGIKSLKTWHTPKQGIATANSPYSGLLDAMLNKVTGANYGTPENNAVYKNLTDPLTQGMGLDSLAKPKLTYDTSNPAGILGLGNVSGTLQPLNTQVTSSPTYNQNQIANKATVDALAKQQADALAKQQADALAKQQADALAKQQADALAKQQADALAKQQADALAKQQADAANKALLSKYNFNNYVTPETRAALASNPSFYNSVATTTPGLADQIKYSTLIDSLAGNTSPTTTASSLQNASSVAGQYNANTADRVNWLKSEQDRTIAFLNANANNSAMSSNVTNAKSYLDSLNTDLARTDPNSVKTYTPNTGIATNIGNFTSTDNMNTAATGANGAPSIVSLLNIPNAIQQETSTPINAQPNYVNLSMANEPLNIPNAIQQETSTPINAQPNYVNLSMANEPLNIASAYSPPVQTSPINAQPNYVTLSMGAPTPPPQETSTPINLSNPNQVSLSTTPVTPSFTANDYITPETRNAITSNTSWYNSLAASNPSLADQIAWSASQDSSKQ